MRLAFVVGSNYEKNGQVAPLTSSEVDVQLLARRLGLDDIGATVVELPAERGVAERLEQALTDQPGPVEWVLVVFVGYGVFSKERGPALLLDGDRLGTFSFVRLRSLLERYSQSSCVAAEVLVVGDGQDLAEVVTAIAATFNEKHGRGTSGLIAVRPSTGDAANEPALAPMLVTALDWLSASGSQDAVISLGAVYEAIQADERFKSLPITRLVSSTVPFAFGPANGAGRASPKPSPGIARISGIPPVPPPSTPPESGERLTPAPALAVALALAAAEERAPDSESEERTGQHAFARGRQSSDADVEDETDEAAPDSGATPTASRAAEPSELDGDASDSEAPVSVAPDSEDRDARAGRVSDSDSARPLPPPTRSVQPLPLPSRPVKNPSMTPPPPLPGMQSAQPSAERSASRPPAYASPGIREAAALFEAVAEPRNGATNGAALLAEAVSTGPSVFRPTVAVAPLSERYGDDPPPSDALPSFGGATLAADELLAKGELEAAVQEYEAVLVLLGEDDDERAPALARLSLALSGLGRRDDAEARQREAAGLADRHPDVLRARAELDDAASDMAALLVSAEAWLMRAQEHPRAIELLAKAAEATGDVRRGLEARRRLARSSLSGPERARAFLESSLSAEGAVLDDELALALSLEGLELAPSHLGLLDRAQVLLERAGRRHELLSYLERAMSQILDPDSASAVAERLERLALEPDVDPRIAAAALERLIETRPGDVGLRYRVSDLYASLGDVSRALMQCRAAARLAAGDPETYRRAHTLFERLGDTDGAWNACAVLDTLGEADINESLFAGQHRPEGLLAVRGVLTDADWSDSLFHEDGEPELRALFAALGAATNSAGGAYLKEKKRVFEPDPATLQDPEKSTTMLAKTLGWSSRLLGLGIPELYVLPELAAGLDIAPLEAPAALASRALGTGLELGELAFLWGRQLPRLRPELRPLAFFRTRPELAAFATAALALAGARGVDPKTLERDPKKIYGVLKKELPKAELPRLTAAASKVPTAEVLGRVERLMWTAELAGIRTGLLLVGDVAKAAELIRRYPTEGVTRAEDQLAELYRFSISDGYARLRKRLGISL